MADLEYVLAVGIYDDPSGALEDLRNLTNPGPTHEVLAGAAVITRGVTKSVMQQGGGGTTAYGIGTGAAAGVVAGVVLAVPLVGAVAGAVIGGLVGHHMKGKEAEQLGALLADDLLIGQTALVTVVPAEHQAEVRYAMARARKSTGRVLDDAQSRRLARGLVRGNPDATEVLGG
jgi:phage tail tape-measure protein